MPPSHLIPNLIPSIAFNTQDDDDGAESSATEPDVSTEPDESESATESDSSWIQVDSNSDNGDVDDGKAIAKNRYANEVCNIRSPVLVLTFTRPTPRILFYPTMGPRNPVQAPAVKTSFAERRL